MQPRQRHRRRVRRCGRRVLLAFSLILLLLPAPIFSQQPPQRERRVSPPLVAIPTPAPSPSPIGGPTPPGGPARTAAELQARIAEILRRPELAPAMVGIKIASLETGKVLFEQNANKLLRPASNMKLYTVAAALDRLTPDYRFLTSVYAQAKPDANGIVRGDLTVYGRGDPSISARFSGDYSSGMDELAARIVAAGVKRVEGDLVGDESYFTGAPYGAGWEWEDLQWGFGAEVSALSINDNLVSLTITPGAQVGASAVVQMAPPNPLLTINNHVQTAPRNTRRDLMVYRSLNGDVVEISGSLALDDPGFSGRLGISRPALLFVYLLRAALARRGVVVSGKSRLAPAFVGSRWANLDAVSAGLVELANMQSPRLAEVAAQTLKPSENLYAELLLRTLGKVAAPPNAIPRAEDTSERNGIEVLKTFLRVAGIDPASLVLEDGSGLSRGDMVTAQATLQLLTVMRRHRYASSFREALPIAGVDGTLRNRMKGTAAQNNVRAKTGELSSASSLSGYVTTAAGEELVFSIMVNNFPDGVNPPSVCIDPIVVLLASIPARL